jgi:hypothetical protein
MNEDGRRPSRQAINSVASITRSLPVEISLFIPTRKRRANVSSCMAAVLEARDILFGAQKWKFVQRRRCELRSITWIDWSTPSINSFIWSSCD